MFFYGDECVLLPLYHPEWSGLALFRTIYCILHNHLYIFIKYYFEKWFVYGMEIENAKE